VKRLDELSPPDFEKSLVAATLLSFPYSVSTQRDMPMAQSFSPKVASVLILFGYPGPCILYTRRTESVETHKGQMAFPGGHSEPHELDLDGAAITALRETEEEVGIPREKIRVRGQLPPLVTPTGFLIRPIVGILAVPIEDVILELDEAETAEAIWIPLTTLLGPGTYRREFYPVGKLKFPIDVYQVNQHRIWGATGSMTKNLLDRLEALG
jgi:8-oxo-dGTP pyrophosphatase MutT (NUDIX family)